MPWRRGFREPACQHGGVPDPGLCDPYAWFQSFGLRASAIHAARILVGHPADFLIGSPKYDVDSTNMAEEVVRLPPAVPKDGRSQPHNTRDLTQNAWPGQAKIDGLTSSP